MRKFIYSLSIFIGFGLMISSCSEDEYQEEVLSQSSKKTNTIVNYSYNDVKLFKYFNKDSISMLEFRNIEAFEEAFEYLMGEQRRYEEQVISDYKQSHGDTAIVVYEYIGLDDNYIFKQFERDLNFNNSMRNDFAIYESQWLSQESPSIEHPSSKFLFDDANLSLFNKYGEIKIGDTIIKCTKDGYLAITDGNVSDLIAFNNGDTTILNKRTVLTNITSEVSNCLSTENTLETYEHLLYGLIPIKVDVDVKFWNFLCLGRSFTNAKSYIFLKNSSTGISKWYKCSIKKQVYNRMKIVNNFCVDTGKIREDYDTGSTFSLSVYCTQWAINIIDAFRVINNNSVYGSCVIQNWEANGHYIQW